MNQQIKALDEALEAEGIRRETMHQYGGGVSKVMFWRGNKQPAFGVMINHGEDGYELYLSVDGIKIGEDVEAIKAA